MLRDEEFEEEHDRLMALKPWTRTDSQEEQPDEWRHGQSWGTRFNPEEIADNAHQVPPTQPPAHATTRPPCRICKACISHGTPFPKFALGNECQTLLDSQAP